MYIYIIYTAPYPTHCIRIHEYPFSTLMLIMNIISSFLIDLLLFVPR